jgi:Zn-dependent protease with chaperone function
MLRKTMKNLAFPLALFLFALSVASLTPARSTPPAAVTKSQQTPAGTPSSPPTVAAQSQEKERHITAYTLPPDRYKKAHDLGRIYFRFTLISFFYGLVATWLVLRWKLASKYRSLAEGASSTRFVQAAVFAPLLFLTIDVLELPPGMYQQWLSRSYGISVQGWASWFWDWTKGEFISILLAILLVWILYAVIRKTTRRWWFYFWLVSLPIGLLLIFVQPVIIDPMFHKFEPLAQKDPALTASLENLVQRAGQNIPPERMFWMGAGEKTTSLNAYVAGFGASKRIVVWDTTIAKMNTPQIVYVASHEMGHYVLGHIPKLLMFGAALLFVSFYLGFRCIGWVLARWGQNWEVRGIDDWASLPVLLLLLSIFFFLANPVASAFTRHQEHQADQYGLEVTHGLTPDSGQVAAQAFQVLGEVSLDDPDPSPANVFLFYSHPAIKDRVQFALTYDPWSQGGSGEFVK